MRHKMIVRGISVLLILSLMYSLACYADASGKEKKSLNPRVYIALSADPTEDDWTCSFISLGAKNNDAVELIKAYSDDFEREVEFKNAIFDVSDEYLDLGPEYFLVSGWFESAVESRKEGLDFERVLRGLVDTYFELDDDASGRRAEFFVNVFSADRTSEQKALAEASKRALNNAFKAHGMNLSDIDCVVENVDDGGQPDIHIVFTIDIEKATGLSTNELIICALLGTVVALIVAFISFMLVKRKDKIA